MAAKVESISLCIKSINSILAARGPKNMILKAQFETLKVYPDDYLTNLEFIDSVLDSNLVNDKYFVTLSFRLFQHTFWTPPSLWIRLILRYLEDASSMISPLSAKDERNAIVKFFVSDYLQSKCQELINKSDLEAAKKKTFGEHCKKLITLDKNAENCIENKGIDFYAKKCIRSVGEKTSTFQKILNPIFYDIRNAKTESQALIKRIKGNLTEKADYTPFVYEAIELIEETNEGDIFTEFIIKFDRIFAGETLYKSASFCENFIKYIKFAPIALEKLLPIYERAVRRHSKSIAFYEEILSYYEKANVSYEKIESSVQNWLKAKNLQLKDKISLVRFLISSLIRFFTSFDKQNSILQRKNCEENVRKNFELMERLVLANSRKELPGNYFNCLLFQSFIETKHFKSPEKARLSFEKLVEYYPYKIDTWTKYIEFEKYNGSFSTQKAIISRAMSVFHKNQKFLLDLIWIWKSAVWECSESLVQSDKEFQEIERILAKTKITKITKNEKFKKENNRNKVEKFGSDANKHKKSDKMTNGVKKNVNGTKNSTEKLDSASKNRKIGQKSGDIKQKKGELKVKEDIKGVKNNGKAEPSGQNKVDASESLTVFVLNIDSNVKNKDINSLFSHYGKIQKMKIPKNDDGLCKGYAYVTFREENSAKNAIKSLNSIKFHGQILSVQQIRSEGNKKRTLFVRKLPKNDCEKELREIFETVGKIEEIRRPTERKNKSSLKPFCYITFQSDESINDAIELFKNKNLAAQKLAKNPLAKHFLTKNKIQVERCLSVGLDYKSAANKSDEKTKKQASKASNVKRKRPSFIVPVSVMKKKKESESLEKIKEKESLTNEQLVIDLVVGILGARYNARKTLCDQNSCLSRNLSTAGIQNLRKRAELLFEQPKDEIKPVTHRSVSRKTVKAHKIHHSNLFPRSNQNENIKSLERDRSTFKGFAFVGIGVGLSALLLASFLIGKNSKK